MISTFDLFLLGLVWFLHRLLDSKCLVSSHWLLLFGHWVGAWQFLLGGLYFIYSLQFHLGVFMGFLSSVTNDLVWMRSMYWAMLYRSLDVVFGHVCCSHGLVEFT